MKDSKDGSFSKIPQVCFLSLIPLTQSKLFWNWGTVEWNYLYPGNCGPFEKLSSHGLSAFLNQDCEMLNWHEITPYIWRLTLHHSDLSSGVMQRDISAPDLRLVVWFSRANVLKECADPGSEDLHSERAHDSVGLTKFLCCARARFNPQQDVYTVHDCCMRTPCILQKCTNTPTCAHSCTLESHLSSSVFSTTWCVLL